MNNKNNLLMPDGGRTLTIQDILEVGRNYLPVSLDLKITEPGPVLSSHKTLESISKKQIIYGLTTGFGERATERVPLGLTSKKQENLIASLLCGSGPSLRKDQARAAVFLRLATLAKGYSGVRPAIIAELVSLLNNRKVPTIPSIGSLGCSGDLVPSSYFAEQVLRNVGKFEGKEALALVNGTQFMTGIAALALADFRYLFAWNTRLFAILFQCLQGIEDVFDAVLHYLKLHKEQQTLAFVMRDALAKSALTRRMDNVTAKPPEHISSQTSLQDKYSFRCLPQSSGAVLRVLLRAEQTITEEINSVDDNPVVIGNQVKHGGNFDGTFVALDMAYFKLGVWKLSNIMRAYMRSTIDAKLNGGKLPTYLIAENPGLNNGFQGLGGLSFDAVCIELNREAEPYFIRTANDHEAINQDIVSGGLHEALSAARMVERLETLTAMLAMATRQAVELLEIENKLSVVSKNDFAKLKRHIPFLAHDQRRVFHRTLRSLEKKLRRHVLE